MPAPLSSAKGKVESISSAGLATVHLPTTRAGRPATVVCGGTSLSTTLQAAAPRALLTQANPLMVI